MLNPALHYYNNTIIELISKIFEVNGALIEASAKLNANPISAYFNAPQSLAPSPTIATIFPYF